MARKAEFIVDRGDLPTEQRLPASTDLGGHDIDQTLRLINDQDATVAAAVRLAIPQIACLTRQAVAVLGAGGRVIYFGAGTSGRLGVLDASECPPTFQSDPDQVVGVIAGGDAALRRSSEGAEDDPQGIRAEWERLGVGASDLVLGIAAGGTTPYVIGGIDLAAERGAWTALVTCDGRSGIGGDGGRTWRFASKPPNTWVSLAVGPEVLTGSTRMKAGTATKMVLNMVTTTAFVHLGKTWGNLMVDLHATNSKLQDRAVRILLEACPSLQGCREAVEQLLRDADGQVKVAIVMAHLDMNSSGATLFLERHGGRLQVALGPPPC